MHLCHNHTKYSQWFIFYILFFLPLLAVLEGTTRGCFVSVEAFYMEIHRKQNIKMAKEEAKGDSVHNVGLEMFRVYSEGYSCHCEDFFKRHERKGRKMGIIANHLRVTEAKYSKKKGRFFF